MLAWCDFAPANVLSAINFASFQDKTNIMRNFKDAINTPLFAAFRDCPANISVSFSTYLIEWATVGENEQLTRFIYLLPPRPAVAEGLRSATLQHKRDIKQKQLELQL